MHLVEHITKVDQKLLGSVNMAIHPTSFAERIYKYIILNRASPPSIDKSKVWHIRKKLNIKSSS